MDFSSRGRARPRPGRISQVPDRSLCTRRLLPPGRAERLHAPVTSSLVLASPSLAGWPLPSLRFEAQRSSLALRLTQCAFQGFATTIARSNARSATCFTGTSHGDLLPVTREIRLPGTPEGRGGDHEPQPFCDLVRAWTDSLLPIKKTPCLFGVHALAFRRFRRLAALARSGRHNLV